MDKAIPADARFTARQHQILNAWRDVLEDIRHLCRSLRALSDDCSCGDGPAHLAGRCVCCRRAHKEHLPPCEDCDKLLAVLIPTINSLTVDTWQFFPSVSEFLDLRERQAGKVIVGARERHFATVARQDATEAVERHIAAVIGTFERVAAAVDEFRAGCRASHLEALKSAANDLLAEVERLDRAL